MTLYEFINTGSGAGAHQSLTDFALAKFGYNPNKDRRKDKSSYDMTNDKYANDLLALLTGVCPTKSTPVRLHLRTLVVIELGNYLTFGIKTPDFIEKHKRLDKIYWCDCAVELIRYGLILPPHNQ